MKCPTCGTEGVEGGVCFYCEARNRRSAHKRMNDPEAQGTAVPPGPEAGGDGPHALVLGGGLAGLSAANRLKDNGWRLEIFEAGDEVGGLAGSFTVETEWGEFDYDNGPHRFHTGETHLVDEVLRLLGDNVCQANRQSRIYLYKRFFHYPLQGSNVLKCLPKTVLVKAFWDYLTIKVRSIFAPKPDDNFENWVVNRFGRKLYDVFFGTYTEKTWGIPCTRISADWAAQRISLLSLWDTVKKTLFRPKNVPRTLVSKFYYPRRGGIGYLCRRYRDELVAAGNPVNVANRITAVHHENGAVTGVTARGKDGERFVPGETVLSTVPLTTLVRLMSPAAPDDVLAAADRLSHRSMIFVYMILDQPKLTDDHWIYLPEKEVKTHRLSEFKNFSPDSAPEDKTLICAEITCDFEDEDWKKTDEELQEIVVHDLTNMGLIDASKVLRTFSRRERYAYPIYDLTYRENKVKLEDYVASIRGLDTTGRQGLFKYNNMDHSIGMGLTAAENLMGQGEDHKKIATGQEYFG